jgi:hypothetical protein
VQCWAANNKFYSTPSMKKAPLVAASPTPPKLTAKFT